MCKPKLAENIKCAHTRESNRRAKVGGPSFKQNVNLNWQSILGARIEGNDVDEQK